MPNWCNNGVVITGPQDSVAALWAQTSDLNGLLQAMLPMPSELNETKSPGDSPNWYDWRVSNWGTKWDVSIEGLEYVDNQDGTASILGYFESAWSPPIEAFKTFSEENPDYRLELKYFEPGMNFMGIWTPENGNLVHEDVVSLLRIPPDRLPNDVAELLEYFDARSWYDLEDEEEDD